jgi:hypothetical protein
VEDLSNRRRDAGETFGQLFLGFPAQIDTGGVYDSSRTEFTARREVVGFRTSVNYQHTHNQVLEPLTP